MWSSGSCGRKTNSPPPLAFDPSFAQDDLTWPNVMSVDWSEFGAFLRMLYATRRLNFVLFDSDSSSLSAQGCCQHRMRSRGLVPSTTISSSPSLLKHLILSFLILSKKTTPPMTSSKRTKTLTLTLITSCGEKEGITVPGETSFEDSNGRSALFPAP